MNKTIKLTIIGVLVLSTIILGVYIYGMINEKKCIEVSKGFTYACLGGMCVTIPKNSEFVLFVKPNATCRKRMYIDSWNGTIIYAIVCKNGTLEKMIRKNYTIYELEG